MTDINQWRLQRQGQTGLARADTAAAEAVAKGDPDNPKPSKAAGFAQSVMALCTVSVTNYSA